ncbi:hypothetical protein V8C86DRAFT_1137634 [Haematococcus lacustris]
MTGSAPGGCGQGGQQAGGVEVLGVMQLSQSAVRLSSLASPGASGARGAGWATPPAASPSFLLASHAQGVHLLSCPPGHTRCMSHPLPLPLASHACWLPLPASCPQAGGREGGGAGRHLPLVMAVGEDGSWGVVELQLPPRGRAPLQPLPESEVFIRAGQLPQEQGQQQQAVGEGSGVGKCDQLPEGEGGGRQLLGSFPIYTHPPQDRPTHPPPWPRSSPPHPHPPPLDPLPCPPLPPHPQRHNLPWPLCCCLPRPAATQPCPHPRPLCAAT